MNKSDYIEFWKTAAEKDWIVVENLFEKENYPQSLFFAHLVLEKLIKAHWVQNNTSDFPPRVHNLVRLASQSALNFTAPDLLFLDKMNDFQMEGRYPDYAFLIYQICTEAHTKALINDVNTLRIWLISQLP